MVIAEHGGNRVAVPDGLAPSTQVGGDAERLPTATVVQTEAGPDLVDDERGPVSVTQLAYAPGERRIGQFLVAARIMTERRDDDRRDIVAARLLDCSLDARDIVEPVGERVRPFLGREALGPPVRPGCPSVVRTARREHCAPSCR